MASIGNVSRARLGMRVAGAALVALGCFAIASMIRTTLFPDGEVEPFNLVSGFILAGGIFLVGVLLFYATPYSELSDAAKRPRKRFAQLVALVVFIGGLAGAATEAFGYLSSGDANLKNLMVSLLAALAGLRCLLKG